MSQKKLDHLKNTDISAAAGLQNYVVKNTDHTTVRTVYEKRDGLALQNLESDTKNLEKNGLNDYMEGVKAQNAAVQQAMQKSAPHLQQVQQQMQAQPQPQPEPPKPPVMGG